MSEQMRKEFEAWAVSVGKYVSVDEDGEYNNAIVDDCWQAWQASRAAIVVELRGKVIEALEKSGASYK